MAHAHLHSSGGASLGVNSRSQHLNVPHLGTTPHTSITSHHHFKQAPIASPVEKPFKGGNAAIHHVSVTGHMSSGGPQGPSHPNLHAGHTGPVSSITSHGHASSGGPKGA